MTALTLQQQAQERALLAAILAEPAADDLRLIYADWLEETGEEVRAEFVRWQIEAARQVDYSCRCDGGRMDCPACRLERRGYAARNAWKGYTEWWDDDLTVAVWWRRGFVNVVKCPLVAWEEHGPALCARHPVERVEVTDAHFVSTTPAGLRNLGLPSTANLAVQIHFRPWPPALWQTLIAVALDMPKGRSIVVGDPNRPGVERSRNILFCTMGDMRDCVSAACLIHARDQALTRGLLP